VRALPLASLRDSGDGRCTDKNAWAPFDFAQGKVSLGHDDGIAGADRKEKA